MNFKTEITDQLKQVKIIENPICKVIQINVMQQQITNNLNIINDNDFNLGMFKSYDFNEITDFIPNIDNFLEFEDVKFNDNDYIAEKRKAATSRHLNTTMIKNDVIQNMFNHKRNEKPQSPVSDIINLIIKELYNLINNQSNIKIQNFMQKYSITNEESIKKTITYLNKNHDGGQIPNWCYKFNKTK